MADQDENLPRRIEAVFERMGLGNTDPEKLNDYVETYEKTMQEAKKPRKKSDLPEFDDVLAITPPRNPEEESS
jgi:hypothetical protein